MKITNRKCPPDDLETWWVGQHAKCQNCGSTVQLEQGDYVAHVVRLNNESKRESYAVTALCPVCGNHGLTARRF